MWREYIFLDWNVWSKKYIFNALILFIYLFNGQKYIW